MKKLLIWVVITPLLVGLGVVLAVVSIFGGIGALQPCQNGAGGGISSATGPEAPGSATLFEAIAAVSVGNNRLTVSMLTGSKLEADWNPRAVGAGSYGSWQIQDPGVVHPDITVAQAFDPAYSTNYMAPAYRSGLNNVDPALWARNPEQAAATAAYNAERPKYNYYVGQGAAKVHSAYLASVQKMNELGISTDFGLGSVAGGGTGSTVAAVDLADSSTCTAAAYFGGDVTASGAAKVAITAARSQLGVPYVWGGTTPRGSGSSGGLDCSGLTQYSLRRAGIAIPRTAGEQWAATRQFQVPLSQAKPGDLVFFVTSGSSSDPGHVGIYLGNGMMINAPHTGANVRYEQMTDSYWKAEFLGATDPYVWAAAQHNH